eukprot:CAMPEP_0198723428 /NCGR_PEP_ID=MMETSP1475-20131203/931_1 /TAXON_ID= ORGANISM="Unidentified sp., Strain CCMP1999" /NCGR_SAMPLE_ID=MMETSP1475 /ASSEMBLY_ACC=CAM_ASM_001111 /LENGTH=287 /DNA_ID=CAMNT_0044484549 /DNA_START=293 /DNA_END=1153 /DNA_ORIENTATION=+
MDIAGQQYEILGVPSPLSNALQTKGVIAVLQQTKFPAECYRLLVADTALNIARSIQFSLIPLLCGTLHEVLLRLLQVDGVEHVLSACRALVSVGVPAVLAVPALVVHVEGAQNVRDVVLRDVVMPMAYLTASRCSCTVTLLHVTDDICKRLSVLDFLVGLRTRRAFTIEEGRVDVREAKGAIICVREAIGALRNMLCRPHKVLKDRPCKATSRVPFCRLLISQVVLKATVGSCCTAPLQKKLYTAQEWKVPSDPTLLGPHPWPSHFRLKTFQPPFAPEFLCRGRFKH